MKLQIRPELIDFTVEMEKVLRENDHKTGWNEMSIHQLFGRIKEEFEELQREYILICNSLDGIDRNERLRKEAIDIANFCMFLCHNYPIDANHGGSMERPKPHDKPKLKCSRRLSEDDKR